MLAEVMMTIREAKKEGWLYEKKSDLDRNFMDHDNDRRLW